jgi:hypothetical protein
MKPADNFDLRQFITEGRLLKENINEGDLKMYYDILMDIGGEDLAGEYEDLAKKAKQYKSFAEFVKNDLEVLNQDDSEQVDDIKTDFVSAKIRKMSPEEFTMFVKNIGDYDLWNNAPNEIDPFNNVGQRMDVLSNEDIESINKYFDALVK